MSCHEVPQAEVRLRSLKAMLPLLWIASGLVLACSRDPSPEPDAAPVQSPPVPTVANLVIHPKFSWWKADRRETRCGLR